MIQKVVDVLCKVAQEFSGDLIVTENGIGTDDDVRRYKFIQEAFAGIAAAKKAGVILHACNNFNSK